MVLKDSLGPYISCHVLSLIEKVFINGDKLFVRDVVNIWINHSEIDDSPNFIYVGDLNDKVIPKIVPVNNVVKIKNLNILGKMRIW